MNEKHMNNAMKLAFEKGGVLVNIQKHKNDNFLYEVIVFKKGIFAKKDYIVWLYNANDNGFSNGDYDLTLSEANARLRERLK